MNRVLHFLIAFCKYTSLVIAAGMTVAMVCIALSGCATRDKSKDARGILGADESAFKLVIVMDSDVVMRDGHNSWQFVLRSLDHYFVSRVSDPADEVLICGLVPDGRSLFWQGTPRHLREEFPSQDAFKSFMVKKFEENRFTDHVQTHRGVSHALRYVTSLPAVKSRQAQTVTLVLSSLIDTSPDTEATADEMLNECVKYIKGGGEIGFYWSDQDRRTYWIDKFEKAGYPLIPIALDIQGRPPLPDFERLR